MQQKTKDYIVQRQVVGWRSSGLSILNALWSTASCWLDGYFWLLVITAGWEIPVSSANTIDTREYQTNNYEIIFYVSNISC